METTRTSAITVRYAVKKHAGHHHGWLSNWHGNTRHDCTLHTSLLQESCRWQISRRMKGGLPWRLSSPISLSQPRITLPGKPSSSVIRQSKPLPTVPPSVRHLWTDGLQWSAPTMPRTCSRRSREAVPGQHLECRWFSSHSLRCWSWLMGKYLTWSGWWN